MNEIENYTKPKDESEYLENVHKQSQNEISTEETDMYHEEETETENNKTNDQHETKETKLNETEEFTDNIYETIDDDYLE